MKSQSQSQSQTSTTTAAHPTYAQRVADLAARGVGPGTEIAGWRERQMLAHPAIVPLVAAMAAAYAAQQAARQAGELAAMMAAIALENELADRVAGFTGNPTW